MWSILFAGVFGLFLAGMGWGINSMSSNIYAHTAAIAHLETIVDERSKQQAETLDKLNEQVRMLNSFGAAPSELIASAGELKKATDGLTTYVSTFNETLSRIQNVAMRLDEHTREPFDAAKLGDRLEERLNEIKVLLEDLKKGQGKE
jgi:hypothetical protein